jgi:hypothetical protein
VPRQGVGARIRALELVHRQINGKASAQKRGSRNRKAQPYVDQIQMLTVMWI